MSSLLKNYLLPNNCSLKSNCRTIIFVITLFSYTIQAQIANYVSNGGFEEYNNCTLSARIDLAKNWSSLDSITNTGLYRSSCPQLNTVPYGPFGFQYPKKGGSFALTTFMCEPAICSPTSTRNYIKNRLKNHLDANKIYCVKFYVNVTNNSPYGMDGCGAYFASSSIDTITLSKKPLSYLIPQIQNPSGNLLIDTLNWILITGTFVAAGDEKYMVIGNFKPDTTVNKININSSLPSYIGTDLCIDHISCLNIDLPANAGLDTICLPGTSVYIGRQRDVGIDEDCMWYQLPDMNTAIDTAAGLWVSPLITTTYVVRQEICGNVKWDTVVVHQTAVGLEELKLISEDLKVFPVPAQEEITLQFTLPDAAEKFRSISIYNNLGQLLREEEITFKNKSVTIKTNDLPAGVYHLQLRTAASETVSKRFVISR